MERFEEGKDGKLSTKVLTLWTGCRKRLRFVNWHSHRIFPILEKLNSFVCDKRIFYLWHENKYNYHLWYTVIYNTIEEYNSIVLSILNWK